MTSFIDTGKQLDLAAKTPARLFVPLAGESYLTHTQLELRADHAAARDAVQAELDLGWLESYKLHLFESRAVSKADFLRFPHLGRKLSDDARSDLSATFPREVDVQIVVGDGLSVRAIEVQVPTLLPKLVAAATQRGWHVGVPFAVRHCRVGIMNDIGEILNPRVVVLLIGERPGLATAESLSAYMAYRPRPGHTDAKRNLISNIHARGVSHDEAVRRTLDLAAIMMKKEASGVEVKEGAELESHARH
jgi:ethanolamine ammonia-lyase small subunit